MLSDDFVVTIDVTVTRANAGPGASPRSEVEVLAEVLGAIANEELPAGFRLTGARVIRTEHF